MFRATRHLDVSNVNNFHELQDQHWDEGIARKLAQNLNIELLVMGKDMATWAINMMVIWKEDL